MSLLVAVHGSYFTNNFGDTLLVKLLCDRIAARVGGDRVFLAVPGDPIEQRAIGYPVLPRARRRELSHLVFAGGGYLCEPARDRWGVARWSWRNYRRHLVWARPRAQRRVAFVGVGLGPLSIGPYRRAVGRRFARADAVLLRDAASLDYFRRYRFRAREVAECVDCAFWLPRARPNERAPLVGLHIGELDGDEIELVLRVLGSAPEVAQHRFELFSDHGHALSPRWRAKLDAAARALALEDRVAVAPYVGVDALLARLADYRFVVTCKLHVGIVSIALGGRALAVPVHHKTQRLYAQLGLERFCIERVDLSEARLRAALVELLAPGGYAPRWPVVAQGLARVDAFLEREFPLAAEV